MNQIYGPPNDYNFGLDFDYSVWPIDTVVDLINVPWNNDYRDIVRFVDKPAREAWMEARASSGIKITQLSYVKVNEPIRVDVPLNRALKYNYLRATNPLQPVPDDEVKVFYYFILDARYIAPQTTELVLQLDVWQTYGYDATFGSCYVERGHIGIANENAFTNYGRDYLTVPEGLDIGSDYRVVAKRTKEIMGMNNVTLQTEMDILVVSTIDLDESNYPDGFGTETDPHIQTTQGSTINGMNSGAGFYIFESADFGGWLFSMRQTPWITQGIISITAVPKLTRYSTTFTYGDTPQLINYSPLPIKYSVFDNWRQSSDIFDNIPTRYHHLLKLFTAPYMVIEATVWGATPILMRPEAWNNVNAELLERATYLPPNQRVQITPRRYNSNGQAPENHMGLSNAELEALVAPLVDADILTEAEAEAWIERVTGIGDDYGDYLDMMTQVTNFPSLPLVNDMAISYLASNNAGLQHQRNSSDWTQQRALGMASGQYDIATGAMHTAMSLSGIGVNADIAQTDISNRLAAQQAVVSGLSSIAGGAANGLAMGGAGVAAGAVGGAINAASNGVNTALSIAASQESLGVRNTQAADTVISQNRQSQLTRDTNKSLADWAAKGDYANAIAGINAKVQDAAMIQPSMSGQFGGDASNVGHGTMELSVRWKLIDPANIRVVCEYWLRYGYAIRAFINMPSNFMVMTKFTYWKLTETYIIASEMPEAFKQIIRGIFEKGVTVWANPADIGNVDMATNLPIEGVSY